MRYMSRLLTVLTVSVLTVFLGLSATPASASDWLYWGTSGTAAGCDAHGRSVVNHYAQFSEWKCEVSGSYWDLYVR